MTIQKNTKIAAIAVIIVLAGLAFYHDMRTSSGSNDFDTYYFAGKLLISGENLYTHPAFSSKIGPYLYLPFFAVCISPLTFLHIRAAALLWYFLGIFSFWGALYFSAKIITGKFNLKEIFLTKPFFVGMIAVLFPVIIWLDNISLAQVDFMILCAMLASLFLFDKKKEFLSGLVMAMVSVIKIYPAYFLIYFIAKRRIKSVFGFLLGIILFAGIIPFAVMGRANFIDSMNSWREIKVSPYLKPPALRVEDNFTHFESLCKPSNQSLPAVTTRYLVDYDYRHKKDISEWIDNNVKYKVPFPYKIPPKAVDLATKILYLIIFIVTFASVDYKGLYKTKISQSLEYSLMFLSMILFFPVVQTHLYAAVLFPAMVFSYIKKREITKWIYSDFKLEAMFIAAFGMYVLQADKYMKILGMGCFSIILLWLTFLVIIKKEKNEKDSGARLSNTAC